VSPFSAVRPPRGWRMKPALPRITRRYVFGAGPVKDETWRRGQGQPASESEVAGRRARLQGRRGTASDSR
jgi:hypothetical protein